MAQYEEQNPLDYRAGGDTVDDFAQKYMKEMSRIYQFLNNLREHNSTGPNQVEPQPYMFKVTDNKLYIRNAANTDWLYLFDVSYRMGMSDNAQAVILTSDDVTTTAEALKLVKTNSDGDIDADITGNAYKFGNKTADQYVTVDEVSDAGAALKIVKTDSNGVAHVSISGSAVQLNGQAASYYLNVDEVATVPAGTITDTPNKLVKTNANGVLPVDILGNVGKMAGKNIEVNNLQDGQVFTYRSASNTWRNEDKGVVGAGKALAMYDGNTLLFEYSGDTPQSFDTEKTAIKGDIDDLQGDVSDLQGDVSDLETDITGIQGNINPFLRQPSTAYVVGAVVYLPAMGAAMYLECTTAGTTDSGDLVISTPTPGDTISDGTVVWKICKVDNTDVATTSANGLMSASDKTKLNGIESNANNYSLPTASSTTKGGIKVGRGLSMSGETLNATGAGVANDYIIEKQVNSDGSWYRKYNSGWVEQGGLYTSSGSGDKTITFLKAMSNTNYVALRTNVDWSSSSGLYTAVKTKTTTTITMYCDNALKLNWFVCGQGA